MVGTMSQIETFRKLSKVPFCSHNGILDNKKCIIIKGHNTELMII